MLKRFFTWTDKPSNSVPSGFLIAVIITLICATSFPDMIWIGPLFFVVVVSLAIAEHIKRKAKL